MKRFRFPLKPVAILRAHREAEAREVFGAAVRAAMRAEATLTEVRARVAEFEAAIGAGRRASFSAAAEAQALASYRRERLTETETERATAAAHAEVGKRRQEYLEAHRRVEVVDRLEEKAREHHRQDGAREEQAAFDELTARRLALRTPAFSS